MANRDLQYEEENIGYDSQYPDGGIKCKNYELCEAVLPTWWFECKENYLCTNCDMLFGLLRFSDDVECGICLESTRGVSHPNCDHKLCIQCFKRSYYGDKCMETEPKFPYPDIEHAYFDDQENPQWNIDYPLIKAFNEAWNQWDDDRQDKYENEEYLRKCHICRK